MVHDPLLKIDCGFSTYRVVPQGEVNLQLNTLEKAIEIAAKAHAGAVDKAGQPYLLHPLRVMFAVSKAAQIPAVLHDVLEDSKVTLEHLREAGFSEDVIEAVRALTKTPADETDYFEYLRRLAANPIAREVKIADLRDNMDLSRISNPTDKDWARLKRYRQALAILEGMPDPNEPENFPVKSHFRES